MSFDKQTIEHGETYVGTTHGEMWGVGWYRIAHPQGLVWHKGGQKWMKVRVEGVEQTLPVVLGACTGFRYGGEIWHGPFRVPDERENICQRCLTLG